MSELEEKPNDNEARYDAQPVGDLGGAPAPDRPERRQPASDEEAEQDNYANTDDQEA